MYKVFVTEKKLSLTNSPLSIEKKIRFEDETTFEIALDLLENTSCTEVNIYSENLKDTWRKFNDFFKIIEAAGGIVSNPAGETLFIHRLGRWDLPKGKIETGESLEEAAVREIEEETALKKIDLQHFINTTYHIYREKNGTPILKKTHWYKMNYNGDSLPIPQIEEGITQVSWKNKEEILKDVLSNTFQNIKLILEDAKII